MAVMNLESLVLRGVTVVRDVVIGLERAGSVTAGGNAPTIPPSFARHLSPSDPRHDAAPAMRYELAGNGVAHTARRAGRPGSSAGVPGSRPASFAGQTILSGWSVAMGTTAVTGTCQHDRLAVVTPGAGGWLLSGQSQSFQRLLAIKPAGPVSRSWRRSERNADAKDEQASKRPAHGMPSASLRGR